MISRRSALASRPRPTAWCRRMVHHGVERPRSGRCLAWVKAALVNSAGAARRAAEIGTRRTVKKDYQLAWLLRAVTCIDLTTLAGDDTPGNVQRLCAKAKAPISASTLEALGASDLGIKCGAVCVYPGRVADAVACLKGSGIPVASVATGFSPARFHEHKFAEIRGAWRRRDEIDPDPRTTRSRAPRRCTRRSATFARRAAPPAEEDPVTGELPTRPASTSAHWCA